jgi:hypothetical protein
MKAMAKRPSADTANLERYKQTARKVIYSTVSAIEVRAGEREKRAAIAEALAAWRQSTPSRHRRRRTTMTVAGCAAVMLVTATTFAVAISPRALPGDPLWRVKRAKEALRQWVARGNVAEAQAALDSTEARLREAHTLADSARITDARKALSLFYDQFEEVRWRLRAVLREAHPELFERADAQLAEAAELDERLNGPDMQASAPRGPDVVGTPSPTPKPPWEPEFPAEEG